MAGGSACTMLTECNKDLKCNIKVGSTNTPKDSSVVGSIHKVFEEQFSSDNCPFYTPSMPANYLTQGKGLLSIAFLGVNNRLDMGTEVFCKLDQSW